MVVWSLGELILKRNSFKIRVGWIEFAVGINRISLDLGSLMVDGCEHEREMDGGSGHFVSYFTTFLVFTTAARPGLVCLLLLFTV